MKKLYDTKWFTKTRSTNFNLNILKKIFFVLIKKNNIEN